MKFFINDREVPAKKVSDHAWELVIPEGRWVWDALEMTGAEVVAVSLKPENSFAKMHKRLGQVRREMRRKHQNSRAL